MSARLLASQSLAGPSELSSLDNVAGGHGGERRGRGVLEPRLGLLPPKVQSQVLL